MHKQRLLLKMMKKEKIVSRKYRARYRVREIDRHVNNKK